MAGSLLQAFFQKLTERLSKSRDFTIAFLSHIILVSIFGTTVLFQVLEEPPDFSSDGDHFVEPLKSVVNPPTPPSPMPLPSEMSPPQNVIPLSPVIIDGQSPLSIDKFHEMLPEHFSPPMETVVAPPSIPSTETLTKEQMALMEKFVRWRAGRKNSQGTRLPEFEFTAYLGRYARGDWSSTNNAVNDKIENGSLPNLLYFMSSSSRDRIKTNYKDVRVLSLDSDELFSMRPPFIFLTGTQDFQLTEREVENLREYLRLGGAIWGDSSVPGRNSRFDIAFRREMQRVIADVDKNWEQLPTDHPIFAKAYFPEIRAAPAGLNFYREPVYVLRVFGEIAIIYTANDYGNMWQIGLDEKGNIDLRRNEKGSFVAINEKIWNNRGSYFRNLSPESLSAAYKFGTNVIIHLLTRWEDKLAGGSSL